jgi:hypothetical protein
VENDYEFAAMIKETFNDKGHYHSFNDEPAYTSDYGARFWYKDGYYHRDNGEPAYISSTGIMFWYIDGTMLVQNQIELLKKINATEIKYLPWLLNEDELLNSVIEKRLNEGT